LWNCGLHGGVAELPASPPLSGARPLDEPQATIESAAIVRTALLCQQSFLMGVFLLRSGGHPGDHKTTTITSVDRSAARKEPIYCLHTRVKA
jgi:hypothetical protein